MPFAQPGTSRAARRERSQPHLPGLIAPQYKTGTAALSSEQVAQVRRDAPGVTVRRVSYTPSRGWSAEQIDAAVDRLRTRGLIDGDLLSAQGLRFRAGLETRTDAMQQSIVDAIGADLDALTKQARRLVRRARRGRRRTTGPGQTRRGLTVRAARPVRRAPPARGRLAGPP